MIVTMDWNYYRPYLLLQTNNIFSLFWVPSSVIAEFWTKFPTFLPGVNLKGETNQSVTVLSTSYHLNRQDYSCTTTSFQVFWLASDVVLFAEHQISIKQSIFLQSFHCLEVKFLNHVMWSECVHEILRYEYMGIETNILINILTVCFHFHPVFVAPDESSFCVTEAVETSYIISSALKFKWRPLSNTFP